MEMNKSESARALVCLLLILIISIGFASAITGSIGNARMILRVSPGETIERSILVKNVNDVAVDVELFASGDLEKDITIKDDSFRLEPGDEKKAYFDVKVKKAGTTESAVNVRFSPIDGGNGVGLMSTIIVISGDGKNDGTGDTTSDGNQTQTNFNPVGQIGEGIGKISNGISMKTVILLLLVVFVLLLVTAFVMLKKSKPKKKCTKCE